MNKIEITFIRYKSQLGEKAVETSVSYGPFDWLKVQVPVIIAEAQNGEQQFDQLAVLYTPVGNYHWKTKDGQRWHDFMISPWDEKQSPRLP